ncbi:MAG TPA: hypothetical protein VMW69_02280 [Spirochaetia bacterium]|nr:hypothetical protein [Spirochaetia bacterium]
MKREIPDFLIEQLYLDEIDPRVKAELLADPEVLRRLENLRVSNAEILEAYPAAAMVSRIDGRLEAIRRAEEAGQEAAVRRLSPTRHSLAGANAIREGARRAVRWPGFFPVLAAAAALALIVGVLPVLMRGGMNPEVEAGVRIKGVGPVLHVYRETSKGVELLPNGSPASVHDLLQLSYISSGAEYGMIFSVDGSGTVTLHYPEGSKSSARLKSGGEVALPYSYELDNAPSFERFYFVTSTREFPVDEILSVARRAATAGNLAAIAFPKGFSVASVTLHKEQKQ